ncbi:hypothetical protein [Serratia quinivorans]|uniref:hypothetical protein n=1 Tax=Serratia quinivorans TaxID=137545 RepID=UPI0021B755AC|nr:hypothetical protein [Serratia quinivorans]
MRILTVDRDQIGWIDRRIAYLQQQLMGLWPGKISLFQGNHLLRRAKTVKA